MPHAFACIGYTARNIKRREDLSLLALAGAGISDEPIGRQTALLPILAWRRMPAIPGRCPLRLDKRRVEYLRHRDDQLKFGRAYELGEIDQRYLTASPDVRQANPRRCRQACKQDDAHRGRVESLVSPSEARWTTCIPGHRFARKQLPPPWCRLVLPLQLRCNSAGDKLDRKTAVPEPQGGQRRGRTPAGW